MGKAGKRGSTGDGDGDGDDSTSLTPFKVYAREVRRQAGAKAKDSGFTSSDLKVHSPQSCARVLLLLAAWSAEDDLARGGQLHVTPSGAGVTSRHHAPARCSLHNTRRASIV
jgi:hypothetical protein